MTVRTLLCAYCRLEKPMDDMKPVKHRGEEFWVCREECRPLMHNSKARKPV